MWCEINDEMNWINMKTMTKQNAASSRMATGNVVRVCARMKLVMRSRRRCQNNSKLAEFSGAQKFSWIFARNLVKPIRWITLFLIVSHACLPIPLVVGFFFAPDYFSLLMRFIYLYFFLTLIYLLLTHFFCSKKGWFCLPFVLFAKLAAQSKRITPKNIHTSRLVEPTCSTNNNLLLCREKREREKKIRLDLANKIDLLLVVSVVAKRTHYTPYSRSSVMFTFRHFYVRSIHNVTLAENYLWRNK